MIQTYLEQIIQKQRSAQRAIEQDLPDNLTDGDILQFIRYAIDTGLAASTAVSHKIADILQLFDRETIISHFSLEEIGALYIQLTKVHPYDITLYESAFHFYDSVMDDSEKANSILKEGLVKIQEHCESIKHLLE